MTQKSTHNAYYHHLFCGQPPQYNNQPPYKSDKQTTYLTPSHVGKAKSAVLQWKVLPIYIIYISPFTTSPTCPFGYALHTLDSHYRITPIAAGQNGTSPLQQKKKRRQIYSLTVPSDEITPLLGQNALLWHKSPDKSAKHALIYLFRVFEIVSLSHH